jgi:UDP:flavonoid glycosyltransferase YjiC (YdhE family)
MPKPDWWNDLEGSRRIVVVTQGTVANYDFGQLLEPTLEALADRDEDPCLFWADAEFFRVVNQLTAAADAAMRQF